MAAAALATVSNRLKPAALAMLCLITMQLMGALQASCTPEPLPMGAARVALKP